MNISKITVCRLFNLGNYEHVRYELTIDVAPSDLAATAIVAAERILEAMKPLSKQCLKTEHELARMADEVAKMKTMPVVDWQRRYGHCTGTAEEVIKRYQESYDEDLTKFNEATARATRARQLFDDLGGAAQWKDSKLDWEDDNQPDEL